jgi:hypothetical protein
VTINTSLTHIGIYPTIREKEWKKRISNFSNSTKICYWDLEEFARFLICGTVREGEEQASPCEDGMKLGGGTPSRVIARMKK